MIKKLLEEFFVKRNSNGFEIYNEAGIQHELAIYLRDELPDHRIMLEYPTSKVFCPVRLFQKKEMDIYITHPSGCRILIELKVPRVNCGTPKEMYHAIEDVKFSEELKTNGFKSCYCVLLTERVSFWKAPRAKSGIYFKFNGVEVNINSLVADELPNFLIAKGGIKLNNTYYAPWQTFNDANNVIWKYYILEF
jgi:hypothetical protein